jgi:hypothetical protein
MPDGPYDPTATRTDEPATPSRTGTTGRHV